MGKRKHKDKKSSSRKKRKLYRHSRYDDETDSDSSGSEVEHDERDQYYHPSFRHHRKRNRPATPESVYDLPLSDTDISETNTNTIQSVIANNTNNDKQQIIAAPSVAPETNGGNTNYLQIPQQPQLQPPQCPITNIPVPCDPGPSTSADTTVLPADILEALGDPKGKEEVFGPNIPEEIANRWGRILVDGLTREQKQELIEKYLVPDNFRLAKAPLLNPEIHPVLSESARNRDKVLEKSQNQLGFGVSGLTNLASCVIEGNINKLEILRKISDISKIFLDLHYEDTKRRRKLVTSSLDKRFLHMITDVKRDNYLFGTNLGEKIKASKTAERSGLQIKRNDATSFKKYPNQGNWKGPPRTQDHRAYRQGGQKNRYPSQASRPRRPAPDRQPRPVPKMNNRTRKTQ